jgi:gamma-glutamyltranspeptidase / glutathione hydrolase
MKARKRATCSIRTLVGVTAGLLALVACQTPGANPRSIDRGIGIPRDQAGFTQGMVVTSEREPAEAAAVVLERGGNAIDAAAVAQFMLNVVEPQSSGIGGGGFMMIYLAESGETLVVDSRESAPAAAQPSMFLDALSQPVPDALASTSGYAVGVPGTLRGIELSLARWGTISLADALAPAVGAAEKGIVVNPRLAEFTNDPRLQSECDGEVENSPYDVARKVFRPGGDPAACGQPLSTGDVVVQPDLARAFRLIAAGGAEAFYDCRHPAGIAQAIVKTQRATRAENDPAGVGSMTCDDLAAYRAIIRQPVRGEYRGYVVRSTPPPSAGGLVLLQMLKMLERFPIGDAEDGFGFGDVPTLNVMQEAMRLAFADRARWIGDTDKVQNLPVNGLTDEAYLRSRAGSCPDTNPTDALYCITAGSRLLDVRAGDPRPFQAGDTASMSLPLRLAGEQQEGTETTHFTIVDATGNIVTYTTSVEAKWGTGLMVPGFGFMLNNQLTDFNFVPRRRGAPDDPDFDPGANDIAPFKRPRSSMAPTIIFARGEHGERPIAAYGSPGGSAIINAVLNVTLDLIDHRLPIGEAVERPRLSLAQPADAATTMIEAGFDAGVLNQLRTLGYRFPEHPSVIGAVQAAVIDPESGALFGDGDARRNGTAIGLPRRPCEGASCIRQ